MLNAPTPHLLTDMAGIPPQMMKPAMSVSLSPILWVKQLAAIRLGCIQPPPSRWLSCKRGRATSLLREFHVNAKRQTQSGLSLIELMISITLGLIILSALTTLFVNQSKARAELDKSNRMIDNGRYALETLAEDLKLAGFYAGLDTTSLALPTAAQANPCSTTMSDIKAALPLHIQGYNAVNATVAATAPPACLPATLKAGSDILVVRRVDTSAAVAQAAAVNGTPYLQTNVCQYDALTHILDNTPASFTLHQMNCPFGILPATGPYTSLRRMMVHIYFIDSNNQAGDGIPTLKRMELSATSTMDNSTIVPLVEGIEFMQIDYGQDTNNDGAVENYITVPALADWPNIMSVKLNIVARNIDSTAGYTDTKTYALGGSPAITFTPAAGDHYKRHAYTQVVRLVNPSGRRAP